MLPLTLGLIWLLSANLIAILPSRDHHWRAAYLLMASGAPILFWIAQTHGTILTLPFLAATASILRWPLWFAWKWLTGERR